MEEFYAEDGYSTFLQNSATSPKLYGITPQNTVITMQKVLGTIKYHRGGCISIRLDLMLISQEVGEINFTLMHQIVDLNCFISKNRDIILKALIISMTHCMVYTTHPEPPPILTTHLPKIGIFKLWFSGLQYYSPLQAAHSSSKLESTYKTILRLNPPD
jgi:hypothetical protein